MTLREKLESIAETGAQRRLIERWLGAASEEDLARNERSRAAA